MQNDKELFEFLELDENGVQAKNINAIDRALGAQFAKMSPSRKTLDAVMAAAARKNMSAFKKLRSLLTYRRVLAAAAAVFILGLIPGLMLKQQSDDKVNYAYAISASAGEIDNVNSGLDEVMSELDYITGENNI